MEEQKNDSVEQNGAEPNKLEECKKQCEEYLNGWKRAKADFINYQKDEAKRFEEYAKFAHQAIIKDIIMVLDSFELALQSQPENKGLPIIKAQLEDALKKYGFETLPVRSGDPFNPEQHEALIALDAPPDAPQQSHTIAEIVEKGYTLYGKVIRPARVKIIK